MGQPSISSDRTALITGAGTGIGRAIATRLAADGLHVIVVGRTEASLLETVDSLPHASLIVGDVTDPALLDELNGRRVDVLVNNAMPRIAVQHLEALDLEVMQLALQSSLLAATRWCQAVVPSMKAAGWGRVIHIGSLASTLGGKGQIAYSTAKAGLVGLTRSIAVEVGPYGVTSNLVEPGLIETARIRRLDIDFRETLVQDTAMRRIGHVDDVAAAVAFLASDGAGYITGVRLAVGGGVGLGTVARRLR